MKHQGSQKGEGSPYAIPRRRDDLNVEELDGEALLYDPRRQAVHRFDAVTLFVWNSCDGLRCVSEVAHAVADRYAVGQDAALAQVERIVAELGRLGLLEQDLATDGDPVPPPGRHSRAEGGADSAELTSATGGGPPDGRSAEPRRLTRREAVSGGVAKLVFVAPVISTFWARAAYAEASNPIGGFSPTGPGECKNVGYSCTVNPDCCDLSSTAKCEAGTCCGNEDHECYRDEDCCAGLSCNALDRCSN